ncbi:MAG: DUF559 domain-containing protein [Jatrophihabitans sp.]|nr:MAG: DUF559 domain-containing protein [Jatrophihabitans sp.]
MTADALAAAPDPRRLPDPQSYPNPQSYPDPAWCPDPQWYADHVLVHAEPGGGRVRPGTAASWRAWWREPDHRPQVRSPAELSVAGFSTRHTRTRVARGVWTAAGHGYTAALDVRAPSSHLAARRRHALGCAAAVRRRPGHVVSGRSAAILHGLPTVAVPRLPELTAPTQVSLGRDRGGAHLRGAGLEAGQITVWHETPVTTVARTLVDLGRHDARDAIMAADAALAERLVDRAGLDEALTLAAGWPGVRGARQVLAAATPLAQSPLESITRWVLHVDGFPAPRLQVWLAGYRVDMLFDRQRVVLEADGLDKYSVAELRREKRREQRLRALGYRVERVTWEDVVRQWPRTRGWLRTSLGLPA